MAKAKSDTLPISGVCNLFSLFSLLFLLNKICAEPPNILKIETEGKKRNDATAYMFNSNNFYKKLLQSAIQGLS